MEKNQKKKETKKPLNKAIQLSGAGLQMGLTIYLGFLLGEWLDVKFETTYLEQTVTLVAIFISTFANSLKLTQINNEKPT